MKINNINKTFRKNNVLKGVNLELEKGNTVHISGVNGSGKSTLLKIICGLIDADFGTVSIKDEAVIGALIETPNFLENETLKSNLRFLAEITGEFNIEYVRELTELFDLDLNSQDKMKDYSLGMRKKSGIIQAIMEHQNILLFDEPFNAMDDESKVVFSRLINSFTEMGEYIVVICSHDLEEEIVFTSRFNLSDGILNLL